jgi:voltage-gated sodium channel
MQDHAYAAIFFIVFILLSTFMVLNLFIGVVVSALDEETAASVPKLTHPAGLEERLLEELIALRAEVGALREQSPTDAQLHGPDVTKSSRLQR